MSIIIEIRRDGKTTGRMINHPMMVAGGRAKRFRNLLGVQCWHLFRGTDPWLGIHNGCGYLLVGMRKGILTILH